MAPAQFNLAEIFGAVAAAVLVVPEHECIVVGDRHFSYAEVDDRTARMARVLNDWGLGAYTERADLGGHQCGQSRLALYMSNGNAYLEGMIGAYRARVAPFNVNYRYVADELVYLLDNAGTDAISSPRTTSTCSTPAAPPACPRVCCGGRTTSTSTRWAAGCSAPARRSRAWTRSWRVPDSAAVARCSARR